MNIIKSKCAPISFFAFCHGISSLDGEKSNGEADYGQGLAQIRDERQNQSEHENGQKFSFDEKVGCLKDEDQEFSRKKDQDESSFLLKDLELNDGGQDYELILYLGKRNGDRSDGDQNYHREWL